MKRTLMKLTALCAVCLFTLSASAGGHPNYLCFTAGEGDATIALNKVGTPTTVTIEYQKNGITDSGWTAVNFETATTTGDITLAANDFVYFRNASDEVTGFSTIWNDYYQFQMTGSIAASGNVMSLIDSKLVATTIPCNGCFYRLFDDCTGLTSAADLKLPATELTKCCYVSMFNGCSGLTTAPELPATVLAEMCYSDMFCNCTNLTTAPVVLPAEELANECYSSMFAECTSLTTAPELPATVLAQDCYSGMFSFCEALETAPALPAEELAENCYEDMFRGCIGLTTAPELPATELVSGCYNMMFVECANLNYLKVGFTDWGSSATEGWLESVAATGTFVCPAELDVTESSESTVPEGWTVQHPQAPDYLCFTANTASSTVSLNKNGYPTAVTIEYSTDGTNWNDYTIGTTITLAKAGDKVYFRNKKLANEVTGFSTSTSNYYQFKMEGSIAASGSVMSLVDQSSTAKTIPGDYCFCNMFSGCSTLTTAPDLPATTLADYCYYNMFNYCTSLTTAPAKLPAETMTKNCCQYMFRNCTSLTTAPELPATTLASNCYDAMFQSCSALTTAPELPATTLADCCYQYMFRSCSTLMTAPAKLPAEELAVKCYNQMFSSCEKLTTAPELPAKELASNCYSSMFSSCSALTTAPELPATTLAENCYQAMFSYCTSLATAPELPATTLAASCYINMFGNCTTLTTAPELPATTLAEKCYNSMFSSCEKLTTAPELPATTLAADCYQSMFSRCKNLTTAPELPATTLASNCYKSMFGNCNTLADIKVAFTNWNTDNTSTSSWVSAVASSGTFTCPSGLTTGNYTSNEVPRSDMYPWAVSNTYDLTVSGAWASMCVNLPLTVPEGAVVYYASEVEGSTITLKPIEPGTVMAAKTAVIVKKPAEGTTVSFPVGIAETVEDGTITSYTDNLFEGTSVDKACEASSVYVLNAATSTADKPMFSNYTGTKLNAHKIWLPKSTTGGAEAIQFRFDDATAITHVPMESSDDALYNLAGQRVSSDYRGIVIQNGKKMWNN